MPWGWAPRGRRAGQGGSQAAGVRPSPSWGLSLTPAGAWLSPAVGGGGTTAGVCKTHFQEGALSEPQHGEHRESGAQPGECVRGLVPGSLVALQTQGATGTAGTLPWLRCVGGILSGHAVGFLGFCPRNASSLSQQDLVVSFFLGKGTVPVISACHLRADSSNKQCFSAVIYDLDNALGTCTGDS